MGLFSIIKSIITFPFRIFRRKKNTELEPLPPLPELPQQAVRQPLQTEPIRELAKPYASAGDDLTKTKLDLIISELDTLKSLHQGLSERLKLIEKKLEEKDRGIRYF